MSNLYYKNKFANINKQIKQLKSDIDLIGKNNRLKKEVKILKNYEVNSFKILYNSLPAKIIFGLSLLVNVILTIKIILY